MAAQLSAYQEAVEHPQLAFSDSELQLAAAECDAFGLPKARSGNMAVVFRLLSAGGDWAVRCFQHLQPEQGGRYAEISRRLRGGHLAYFVPFAFQDKGILVGGSWQPIVKMAWAQGERLDAYLHRHLGDRAALEELAAAWLVMLRDLEQGGIAHGDLQHGNVLVDAGRLWLLDYDGIYVPALAGRPALEVGHPNYQHPGRTHKDFGPRLDRFAGWVVYLSIAAVACRPELWQEQAAGDECLLFRREDFLDPAAPIWRRIKGLGRPRLTELAERLLEAAEGSPDGVPALPGTLPLRDVLQAPAATPAKPAVPVAAARPAAFPRREPPRPDLAPPDAWLPLDAATWVGSAADWLLPEALPGSSAQAHPGPLERWIAGAWLAGVWLLLALGPARQPGLALGILPWTGLGALLLYLCYRSGEDARQASALRRRATQLRRAEARATAGIAAAAVRHAAAQAELRREAERCRLQVQQVRDALRSEEGDLRRDLGLQDFHRRAADLKDLMAKRRQQRLEEFQAGEARRLLESHRVLDDPLLDVRRGARLQLVAAGIASAYDLQAVGEHLAVGRDGVRHYVDAIDPERARRIRQWHLKAAAMAGAAVPTALPPAQERSLQEELHLALRDLRVHRHAALREFLRGLELRRARAAQALQAIHDEHDTFRQAIQAEAQELAKRMRATQATLRQVRWQAAKVRQERERLRDVRFGLFCRELLPAGHRRGIAEP